MLSEGEDELLEGGYARGKRVSEGKRGSMEVGEELTSVIQSG